MIIETTVPDDFDSKIYLELNPDLKTSAIDPKEHYCKFGKSQARLYKHICGTPSDADIHLHNNNKTKRSTIAKHTHIWEWVRSVGKKKGGARKKNFVF